MGCLVNRKHPTLAGVPTFATLSHRLRQLRESSGLTQEEFAEKAGVGYKFYQQIESGRKKQIWLETVARLAAGFGLEAWQLLGPENLLPLPAVAEPPAEYQAGPVPAKPRKKRPRQPAGGKKAR